MRQNGCWRQYLEKKKDSVMAKSKSNQEQAPVSSSSVVRAARASEPLLIETAWEVVNQLGGIYTVIRSKIPSMVKQWGNRYCLVGPYEHQHAAVEFDEAAPTGPFGQAVKIMREWGFEVHHGYWLVTGRPRVVLLDPGQVMDRLGEIKYYMWEHHHIAIPDGDDLLDRVVAFGFLAEKFFEALAERHGGKRPIVAQFHEWMGGTAIPEIRRLNLPIATTFTTHATMLGRYLAMNDPWFYDHLPFVDWERDAARFNIEPQVRLERAAAHGAHVFTTVSDITAWECEHLIGRKVDHVTPNGLNIERFTALHEFQNLHARYKEKIHQMVMGHFFPSYSFNLDRTLYFFTSGRFEYRNKGFDLTLEALARLNWRMKQENIDRTVVFFIITRRPYRSINPQVLQSKAVMEELRQTCESIQQQFGERLFYATAEGKTLKFDDMIDEYWQLRLRRTMQAWKTGRLPIIVTHDIIDDGKDEVLQQIRHVNLLNDQFDKVKIVYHPDFIAPSNPLFGMEYDQFVRGCHLGVFPSYYEPWGYTPLECAARGVPAITSDLAGFGSYVMQNLSDHEERGIYVTHRRFASYHAAADQCAEQMFQIARQNRRDRIALRNQTEAGAQVFDWMVLAEEYTKAHEMAMERAL